MIDYELLVLQLKIDKQRYYLEELLKSGKIDEKMLVNLMNQDSSFGVPYSGEKLTLEKEALREIYNAPFLLCDQEYLSDNIKKLLPIFLDNFYKRNREGFKKQYDDGDITGNEYARRVKLLKYITYESSGDGKNIKMNGMCLGVNDYVLKLK